ncbi:MAG: hypothetical protein ACI84R_002628 [Candidatus Azotimanducaceae bacterium]|jgi:hypothetical protein
MRRIYSSFHHLIGAMTCVIILAIALTLISAGPSRRHQKV